MAITTIKPEAHQLKLQTIMCCAAIKNGTGKTGVYAIPMRKGLGKRACGGYRRN